MKPDLLIAHIDMEDPGGGTAVFAWAVAGLAADYRITVVTLRAATFSRLDARFGTALAGASIHVVEAPEALQRLLFGERARLERLKVLALSWLAKGVRCALGDPLALSTSNELDLGPRAVQYVHFPFGAYRSDLGQLRGPARALARAYMLLTTPALAQQRRATLHNLTLCNSSFTRAHYTKSTGRRAEILYPPVRAIGAGVAFTERPLRVVGIGRIAPEKRWLEAIEVVERVRARGHAVTLDILGAPSHAAYQRSVEQAVSARSWSTLGIGLSRTQIEARVRGARFGLHMAIEEHFGIAVVELLSAGCVTFVHDSAGPAEIVADPTCRFRTLDEAVELLSHALDEPEHSYRLHQRALERAAQFSERRFAEELRNWFARERTDEHEAVDPPLRRAVQ